MADNNTDVLEAPATAPSADLQKMFADTAGARAMVGSLPQIAFIPVLKSQLSTANTSAEYDAEVNKFVDTLGQNPALSTALQKALAEDPTMIDGLKSSGEQDLKAVNTALENPENIAAFTDKLNAIAADPYDNQNFDALRAFLGSTQAAPAAAAPAAPTQDDAAAQPPALGAFASMGQEEFIGVVSAMAGAEDPSEDMRAAANELTQTLKNNPGLTQAMQTAMDDPSVQQGLTDMLGGANADPAAKLSELQSFNETLKNPDNVALFTATLNAVSKDPNDNIDFSLVTQMTALGKKIAKGEATRDDYSAMNASLANAGIVDKRINMMADPSKMWNMFLEEPEEMVRMMMNQYAMDLPPEMQQMLAGTLTMFAQMASAFVDPNGDFIGHYNREIIQPIGGALRERGIETMGGSSLVQRLNEAGTGEPVDPAQGSPATTRTPFSAAVDPDAAAASDRYDGQTREWTAQRAAPAPVNP